MPNQFYERILELLIKSGYSTMYSLELINTDIRPLIKSLPEGKYKINIGDFVVTIMKG